MERQLQALASTNLAMSREMSYFTAIPLPFFSRRIFFAPPVRCSFWFFFFADFPLVPQASVLRVFVYLYDSQSTPFYRSYSL